MDTMRSQVDALDMAGKMMEKFLAIDSSFPTLVDVTQIAPQGMFKLNKLCELPPVSEVDSISLHSFK